MSSHETPTPAPSFRSATAAELVLGGRVWVRFFDPDGPGSVDKMSTIEGTIVQIDDMTDRDPCDHRPIWVQPELQNGRELAWYDRGACDYFASSVLIRVEPPEAPEAIEDPAPAPAELAQVSDRPDDRTPVVYRLSAAERVRDWAHADYLRFLAQALELESLPDASAADVDDAATCRAHAAASLWLYGRSLSRLADLFAEARRERERAARLEPSSSR